MTLPAIEALMPAIRRYLDLMYDSDLTRFDQVIRSTAQLHGFQQGKMQMMTAQAFRDLLASRPSPKSLGAPREEEVLLIDFASSTQALAKVRVRIDRTVFVDYLTYHLIDGDWLITAKGYHVERTYPPAAAAG